jgi:hypothetical protein
MTRMNGIQGSVKMPVNCGMAGMHQSGNSKKVEKVEADVSMNAPKIQNGSLGQKIDFIA